MRGVSWGNYKRSLEPFDLSVKLDAWFESLDIVELQA